MKHQLAACFDSIRHRTHSLRKTRERIVSCSFASFLHEQRRAQTVAGPQSVVASGFDASFLHRFRGLQTAVPALEALDLGNELDSYTTVIDRAAVVLEPVCRADAVGYSHDYIARSPQSSCDYLWSGKVIRRFAFLCAERSVRSSCVSSTVAHPIALAR